MKTIGFEGEEPFAEEKSKRTDYTRRPPHSEIRQRILMLFEHTKYPLTAQIIAKKTQHSLTATQKLVSRMAHAGLIYPVSYGNYVLADKDSQD